MKIFHLKPMNFPKIAGLATGLAAVMMVATVNPAPAQAFTVTSAVAPTTTTLGVTPATPGVAPGSPTLTATVTGVNAAGTVQFLDGTTLLGTSIPVTSGIATKALCGVTAGSHSYTATFTPTSTAAFTSSTSSATPYAITAGSASVSKTTLAVTPATTAPAPASPTLTATVTGTCTAGTVEFFNGPTALGTSPVANGTATLALTAIAAASYAYTAAFTATDATASSSTSPVSTYVVAAPGIVPGVPTGVKATAGNGLAHVTWTLPSGAGTSLITKYTVTATPGGRTATMNGANGVIPNSVDVTGLTNGTSYTFKVTATSTAGDSLSSAASNAITPALATTPSAGSALSNTPAVAATPSPKSSSSSTTPSPLAAALSEVVAPGSTKVVPKGAPNTGAGGASHLR